MKLAITNEQVDPMEFVLLRPADLNLNVAHMVLASQVWDECYIDVDESINEGKLFYLHTKCRRIFPRFPSTLSRHQMLLLTELYPDLTGVLRKAFLKGDDLHGLLSAVWREGCPPGREYVQVSPGQ